MNILFTIATKILGYLDYFYKPIFMHRYSDQSAYILCIQHNYASLR